MNEIKTVVIFAGGKSSRMNQDKSLLPFDGFSSLAEFQYYRLSKIFENVYISCKKNKFDFNVDLIFDIDEESSPLVGLISIFERTDINEVFVISVDSPFVDKEIIQKLKSNNRDEFDIVVASLCKKTQPLCAIYKRSILKKAKAFLSKDIHKLNRLIDELNSKFVEFDDSEKFANLNYYNDYIEACHKSTFNL